MLQKVIAMYDQTGNWKPQNGNDDVAKKVTGLLSNNSSYLKQARTRGAQSAQTRGLLNSSIGAQAGEAAAIQAALPIASQDAQQAHQKNLASQDQGSKERIATMNVGAHDRQYALSGAIEAQKTNYAGLNEVIKNNNLSTDARNAYQTHFSAGHDDSLALIEQIYNIDLDWSSPVVQA